MTLLQNLSIENLLKKYFITLRKNESSVARQAMQWNALDGIVRKKQRRPVERECKNLNKTWSALKLVAQSKESGELALLMPYVGIKETKKKKKNIKMVYRQYIQSKFHSDLFHIIFHG